MIVYNVISNQYFGKKIRIHEHGLTITSKGRLLVLNAYCACSRRKLLFHNLFLQKTALNCVCVNVCMSACVCEYVCVSVGGCVGVYVFNHKISVRPVQ